MALEYSDKKKGSSYRGDWLDPFVRFECGHESTNPHVVMRLHQRVSDREGVGICDDCSRAARDADQKKSAEELALQSVAFSMGEGLSPLTGAREKVERAEKLRAAFFRALQKEGEMARHSFYTPQEQDEGREIIEAVYSEAKEQNEAAWWLASPSRDNPVRHVLILCQEIIGRLRALEEKRFAPVSCGHDGPRIATGARQKMFCLSCREKGVYTLIQAPVVTPSVVLPALEGTMRQVAWAEKIRLSFYTELSSHAANHPEDADKIEALRARMLEQRQARWWIESPSRDTPKLHLRRLLSSAKK
jgi:hypothetical protein